MNVIQFNGLHHRMLRASILFGTHKKRRVIGEEVRMPTRFVPLYRFSIRASGYMFSDKIENDTHGSKNINNRKWKQIIIAVDFPKMETSSSKSVSSFEKVALNRFLEFIAFVCDFIFVAI